ncbi:unnamed protein product [Choristocarpus tenellus]
MALKKGISLTVPQWKRLKSMIASVDREIEIMDGLRQSEEGGDQNSVEGDQVPY